MEKKRPFGEYIKAKRRALGLTQRELAERLFVTESTVSKWERGLSYPDVSMVTPICRTLGISEHEFFTACDDDAARSQAKAASHWRRLREVWRWGLQISYLVAAVTCFICNLAIEGTLSWFWVVLAGLALAFCVTNLPLMLPKWRLPITLCAVSAGTFLVVAVSCWYVQGDWFWTVGLPLTAMGVAFLWGYGVIFGWLPVGLNLKFPLAFLLSACCSLVSNGLSDFLLKTPPDPNDWVNTLVAGVLAGVGLVWGMIGLAAELRNRRRRRDRAV